MLYIYSLIFNYSEKNSLSIEGSSLHIVCEVYPLSNLELTFLFLNRDEIVRGYYIGNPII